MPILETIYTVTEITVIQLSLRKKHTINLHILESNTRNISNLKIFLVKKKVLKAQFATNKPSGALQEKHLSAFNKKK